MCSGLRAKPFLPGLVFLDIGPMFDYGIPVQGDSTLTAPLVKACGTQDASRTPHKLKPKRILRVPDNRLTDSAIAAEFNDSREPLQDVLQGGSYAHGVLLTAGAPIVSTQKRRFSARQSGQVLMCVPAFWPLPRLGMAPHQTGAA